MDEKEAPRRAAVPDACPHCGHALSPWQQVLLGVDRALMCRNCWYRILLEAFDQEAPEKKSNESATESEGSQP